jgi:hypothetical protein
VDTEREVKHKVHKERERQNRFTNIIIKGMKDKGEEEDRTKVVKGFL